MNLSFSSAELTLDLQNLSVSAEHRPPASFLFKLMLHC